MSVEPFHKQTVKNRVVFYIPGFDPMPPNRYRELYRAEAKKQAKVSGFEVDAERISSLDGVARFQVDADFSGQKVTSQVRFLQWNDLVHQKMQEPIWKSWLGMWQVARTVAFSGALQRLLKLHFPPNIAGLYPFFMIPFQIFVSLFLAMAVADFIGGLGFAGTQILGWAVGIAVFVAAVKFWRKLDDHLMPYYLLHDLMFICQEDGYTPAPLRKRFEVFKASITEALDEDFDEVLIVGHSSGVHLGVIILAELLREGKIQTRHNVSFLSLGHAVPLVSYLPGASDLRLALDELSNQEVIKWVDVTAPADGACFALHNPVTSSINVEPDRPMPRMLSAAFRQTLSIEYFRSLRMRFFRLHFQYLCHFDRPGLYDYFSITAGPISLWDRYGTHKNTPSLLYGNYNKFKDEAA